MSETKIAKKSREAVRMLGIPCERVNSGGYRSRMVGAGAGTPDCWTALGWIEFKAPGKKLSPAQVAWHDEARRWGVRVAVSDSVEATIAIVREWLAEHRHRKAMGWDTP